MSKYDSVKEWARVRARISHTCDRCAALIESKTNYHSERLSGRISKPLGLYLGKLCVTCYERSASH